MPICFVDPVSSLVPSLVFAVVIGIQSNPPLLLEHDASTGSAAIMRTAVGATNGGAFHERDAAVVPSDGLIVEI